MWEHIFSHEFRFDIMEIWEKHDILKTNMNRIYGNLNFIYLIQYLMKKFISYGRFMNATTVYRNILITELTELWFMKIRLIMNKYQLSVEWFENYWIAISLLYITQFVLFKVLQLITDHPLSEELPVQRE